MSKSNIIKLIIKNITKISGMKTLLFALLFLLTTFVATAQTFPVQVIPQMIPPYSLKLSDYQTTTSEKLLVNLLLTDTREAGRRIRLKMYIEGQGLQIRNLDFVTGAEPLYLDGGASKRLTNLDLQAYFSLKNLLGISPQQYNRALPGGRYNFCFEVYDFFSGRLLSRKSCVSAYLILNDPPILNMPSRGELVVAKTPQNILFSWTPRHLSAAGVRYEFTLKELWDTGVDPRAAFLSSPPLYQEQTFTPTLLYGPDKIPLLEGKTYGWQVRALVTDGINETSVFKNNGNSEIFYFRYESHCDPPRLSIPQILGETTVQMGWEGSYNHNKYKLQYRKVGYSEETDKQRARREKKNQKRTKKGKEEKEYKPHKVDYDWFEVYTADQQAQLSKLESGQVYEYRVGATCTPLTQLTHYYVYSQIKEFRMITEKSAAEEAAYKCGILSEVKIANQDPLQSLKAGDGFTAGGFPVVAEEVQGSDGKFSGKGFFKTQYLKKFNIAVTFDNITINTDRQMIKGEVVTTYDASWGGILDVDAVTEKITGNKGKLATFDASSIDISEVKIDENGRVVLIDQDGKEHVMEIKPPVVITGKGGKQWKIDKNGKPEYLGKTGAEGGVPDKKNTNGMSGSGKVDRISSKDVSVVFNTSGYYATDQLRTDISDNRFTKQYETLPSESGDYKVLYKMISDAPKEMDIITANVKLSKGRTTDDIIFKTIQGTKVKVKGWDGNTATLELKREFDFVKTEILATVKPKDSTQNYDIAGKANLWQVKSRKVNLTIVPVGGSIDKTNLEKDIKDIYNKVGVDFNITIEEPFEIGRDKWDINGNKKLDIGDSNTLANYTPEQRKIYYHYQQQRAPQEQMYYIFVLGNNIKTTDPDTQGFMPLKRQYGFVYNPKNLARTIAHELGHGVFGLEHPFKGYNITQGKTDLLMDYGKGTALTQMDWQKIHAPGVQLYIFQKDEDGEAVIPYNSEAVTSLLTSIRTANNFGEDKLEINPLIISGLVQNLYSGILKIEEEVEITIRYETSKNKKDIINPKSKNIYEHPNLSNKTIFEYFINNHDKSYVQIHVETKYKNILKDYLYPSKKSKNVILFVSGFELTNHLKVVSVALGNIYIDNTIEVTKKIYGIPAFNKKENVNSLTEFIRNKIVDKKLEYLDVDEVSTKIQEKDIENYWSNIDKKFMSRIGTSRIFYANGDNTLETALNNNGFDTRLQKGKEAGKNLVAKIKKYGVITLDIVAHSMGYAYALGIIETLKNTGYDKLGWFYVIAPENAGAINSKIPNNIQGIYQYGASQETNTKDWIAPQVDIPNINPKNRVPIKEDLGPMDNHSISNYGWIFNFNKKEDGYIKPRD